MQYRETYFSPEELPRDGMAEARHVSSRTTPDDGMQNTTRYERLERSCRANLVPPTTGTVNVVNKVEDAGPTTGHSAVGPHSLSDQGRCQPSAALQWPVKVHIETALTGKGPSQSRSDSPPTPEMTIAGELTDLMQFQLSPRNQITRSRSKAD